MKKTISFVLCMSMLLVAFALVPLQTSAVEDLTPINGLSYEFNTDGNFEGWSAAQKISDLTVAGSVLKGSYNITTGTSKDPRIQSPAALALDPKYCLLKIRMKNTSIATSALLYITRTADGTGIMDNGTRSKSLTINANSDFTEYTFDLSSWASWTTEVYRVWFDVASAFSGSFEYDYIRFCRKGSNVITYNANAGTDTVTNMPAVDSLAATGTGYITSSQIPVRAGYKFLGWSTTQSGSAIVKTMPVSGNVTLYAAWDVTNASYSTEGKYDSVTGKYSVKLFYTANKATNLASFGFLANPTKMTLDSVVYADGIESACKNNIGIFKNENGIYVDQWYPAQGYISAVNKKLIATLTYNMTSAQYNAFVPATDFSTYRYSDVAVDTVWSGVKYLFAPHVASIDVNYEMVDTTPLVDMSSVLITINCDSAKATTSVISGTKISVITDYSFSITPKSGEHIHSVTYKTGTNGTPIVITATDGLYKIPTAALTDSIIIDVIFDEMIDSISLYEIIEPVAGQAISYGVVAIDGRYTLYDGNSLSWWVGETQITGNFGYNKAYTVKVHLKANDLYMFMPITDCYINDTLQSNLMIDPDGSAYVVYTFPATEKQTVSTVAVTGIDAPVRGATPDITAVTGTGYSATVTWSPVVTTTFAPSAVYTATAVLTPDSDYEFANTITAATMNGNNVSATKNANGTITLSYTFPATAKQPLTTVAVSGIDAPVKGATPDVTALTGTGYSATVTWSPTVTTAFIASTVYTATVVLTPGSEYVFADTITSASINGNSVSATKNANGTVTMSYTFPATAAAVLIGDANGDGVVNLMDATRLLKYLSNWTVDITLAACDTNADGNVDMLDITRLLKYLAGWNVTLG